MATEVTLAHVPLDGWISEYCTSTGDVVKEHVIVAAPPIAQAHATDRNVLRTNKQRLALVEDLTKYEDGIAHAHNVGPLTVQGERIPSIVETTDVSRTTIAPP